MQIYVRVAIGSDQFSVPWNRVVYRLFLDTKAQNCLAYGPGVLPQAATAMETSFIIWAKVFLLSNTSVYRGIALRIGVIECCCCHV